jgi:uncharacterized surface protein with fasciclin (FAS1) repeats
MSTVKRAFAAVAASFVIGASSASATNGPFYTCIKKDPVVVQGSIVDAAVATPSLSTLVSLVQSAGLVEALATTPNLTVFAPTNDAFAKIDESVLGAIGGNAEVLTAVLTYHVVPGVQDPRRGSQPQRRATLNGQDVYMGFFGGKALVNNSVADCTPVKTDNGTVWIIDSVLLPQF